MKLNLFRIEDVQFSNFSIFIFICFRIDLVLLEGSLSAIIIS